jgi:hypothetical protein
MEQSPLKLIKRCAEYISIEDINIIPKHLRGIYVLYYQRPRNKMFDVVYVGMATSSIMGAIKESSKEKAGEQILARHGKTRDGNTDTIVFIGERSRHGSVCEACWGYRIDCNGSRIGQCAEALDNLIT